MSRRALSLTLVPAAPAGTRRALAAAVVAASLGLTAACGGGGGEDAPEDSGAVVLDTPSPAGTPRAGADGDESTAMSPAPVSPAPPAGVGDVPTLVLDEAEVEIEDQSGDGRSVVVQEVQLPGQPGHVVVHRGTAEQPGEVLGSAPVSEGDTGDVRVELDTPLAESGPVTALLHVDDGDGVFDELVDARVLDEDGELEGDTATYTVE